MDLRLNFINFRILSTVVGFGDSKTLAKIVHKKLLLSLDIYNIYGFYYNILNLLQNDGKSFDLFISDTRLDLGYNQNHAIKTSCRKGILNSVIRLLKDPNVDPTAQDNYAIREASKNGHLDVVKVLLEDGRVDPSAKNDEAIKKASENGHVEIVEIFLGYNKK